jgi:hypothetical protein
VAPSTPSTPPPRPAKSRGSADSTKKAARLAQRGKGKKVRFQGGTLFPLIVAIVLVLGVGTIVYARQSVPAADASPPTVNDHWHLAYGFYLCGEWYRLQGNAETTQEYQTVGVHSHDDGVVHWHPFTSKAVGSRAKLGVFLDVYGVEVDNEELTFPDGQPVDQNGTPLEQQDWKSGETQCNGEPGELSVVVWDSFTDTGDGTTYITSFDDIRVTNDAMAFSIAFMPRDSEIPMPPWAPNLPELGAVDNAAVSATTTTTLPGASTVPGATSTTVPSSTSAPSTTSAASSTTAPG